jgi:hypothetical protein
MPQKGNQKPVKGYQGSPQYWADLQAKVAKDREAQGLPPYIQDDVTLDKLAAIVAGVLRGPRLVTLAGVSS